MCRGSRACSAPPALVHAHQCLLCPAATPGGPVPNLPRMVEPWGTCVPWDVTVCCAPAVPADWSQPGLEEVVQVASTWPRCTGSLRRCAEVSE